MFEIQLIPTYEPDKSLPVYEPLSIYIKDSIVVINGIEYDFTELPKGSEIPAEALDTPYIFGEVIRDTHGLIKLRLVFPYGSGAPQEAKFPEPILVTEDGPVTLPDACWPLKEPEYPEEPQPEPEDDSEER